MVQDRRPLRREQLRAKVVYWGPSGAGTTTNLDVLRRRSPRARRGELTTIAASALDGDCDGVFEFMSLTVGRIRGAVLRLDLFTVPGCESCDGTRRMVLHGADAVVFVADGSPARADATRRSFAALLEALRAAGHDPGAFPIVFQWNKRELPGAIPAAELERRLNQLGAPAVHAIARLGEGVLETLRLAARAALRHKDSHPSEERPPLVAVPPLLAVGPLEEVVAEAVRAPARRAGASRSASTSGRSASASGRSASKSGRSKASARRSRSGRRAAVSGQRASSTSGRRPAMSDSRLEPALT